MMIFIKKNIYIKKKKKSKAINGMPHQFFAAGIQARYIFLALFFLFFFTFIYSPKFFSLCTNKFVPTRMTALPKFAFSNV